MSHWSEPSEQLELRELNREAARAGTFSRGWYVVAFLAGIALVCLLGYSTGLFDSGPTALEESAAYRAGFDQGTVDAEARWEDDLVKAWWDGYKRGQASDTSMAPVLIEAIRDGFSWESGFEAGLKSLDVDLDERFRDGWMSGYRQAWAQVTGASVQVPPVPSPSFSSLLQLNGQGDDP